MASNPGILTDWPWKPLGSFKYVVLAPWIIHSVYSYITNNEEKRDFTYLFIFPSLLLRMLHNQIWISLSRHMTAKGTHRIVDKGLEFDQVDREQNWDDQIILNGVLFYLANRELSGAACMPMWNKEGAIIVILLHAGPVEFLYYWLHRALHHHYLYSRYHSHHHSSIVTEPITSVIHPFAEHIAYFLLFGIPIMTMVFTGTASVVAYLGYITYIDFMNNMGHCNFELIPKSLFSLFPPLKYLMYTPSFHSLHHTKFRTNYTLFMPFYDYIYGTMDMSTDQLHETSLQRKEEEPDVVHLTHLTTPDSIYHLRLGFASLASRPQTAKWYTWLMWPATFCSMMLTWVYGRTFIIDRHSFGKLKLQTWAIPKYSIQYFLRWQNQSINKMIEKAILDADDKGCKVLSLGLLNQSGLKLQGEELNSYGGLYVHKYPQLKVKLVDGSGLVVAIVLNSIPKETTQVVLRGKLSKVALAISYSLCQRGVQIVTLHKEEYSQLKRSLHSKFESNLVLSTSHSKKIWLVGEGLSEEEQLEASKGTLFFPYSQFPPKTLRKDCFYHSTPAMMTPLSMENVHSCENWLGRRVMSGWKIGGIVHALEGWKEHECGFSISNIDKVWESALQHGFHPLPIPITSI